MGACEHGDELQKRLRAAFEEWYGSSTFRAKVVKRKPPRRKFTIFSVRQATTLRSMGAQDSPRALPVRFSRDQGNSYAIDSFAQNANIKTGSDARLAVLRIALRLSSPIDFRHPHDG